MNRRSLLRLLAGALAAPFAIACGRRALASEAVGGAPGASGGLRNSGRTERMVRRAIEHVGPGPASLFAKYTSCPSVVIIALDHKEARLIADMAHRVFVERFGENRIYRKSLKIFGPRGRLQVISSKSRVYRGMRADFFIDHSVFESMPPEDVCVMIDSLKYCGEVYA